MMAEESLEIIVFFLISLPETPSVPESASTSRMASLVPIIGLFIRPNSDFEIPEGA